METRTQPGSVPTPTPAAPPPPPEPAVAARKLQDAVDEPQHVEAKKIDVARKIEGASKTFALHENGFLEINFARSVHVKRGTVSSYSGNLKFIAESGLLGTTAQTLVKAVGQGKIFVYEKGRKTFLLDLHNEFIYVEGSNLLALEDSLTYRVEQIYDASYQRKIDTVKIFGKGSRAISTSIELLTMRVTANTCCRFRPTPVAWTGNLIPTVVDDKSLETVMIETPMLGVQIRFGDGSSFRAGPSHPERGDGEGPCGSSNAPESGILRRASPAQDATSLGAIPRPRADPPSPACTAAQIAIGPN
jgi:uncharacterized protein (AIM24 family)